MDRIWELCERRIKEAISHGRVFRNFTEQISWPQLEVIIFLKARSRSIELHIDEPVIERGQYEVIYSDGE